MNWLVLYYKQVFLEKENFRISLCFGFESFVICVKAPSKSGLHLLSQQFSGVEKDIAYILVNS